MLRNLFLTAVALGWPIPVHAQVSSPVQDLIAASKSSLNDLRFDEAAATARAVLEIGGIRRSERVEALHLLAGALYPEVDSLQQRGSALDALRTAIRLAPTTPLPREAAWPGLVQLQEEARRTTFGLAVTPQPGEASLALGGATVLDVAMTRPAQVVLVAEPRGGGQPVPLDSLQGAVTGSLRVVLARREGIALAAGAYDLLVRAVDGVNADTIVTRFSAQVDTPPIELLPALAPFDSASLQRERTAPRRAAGIVGGLFLAGTTVAASSLAHDGTLSPDVPRDSRAVTLGVILGIGTAAGVWLLDRGRPIPANIEANAARGAAYRAELQARDAENERRLQVYRARIIISGEPR